MKLISVIKENHNALCIDCFGYENISPYACWNKGPRDCYIIHYVIEGEGFFNSTRIGAGQGFVIFPDENNEYQSTTENPWTYFWVTLTGDFAKSIINEHIKLNSNNIFEFNLKSDILRLIDVIFSEKSLLSNTKAVAYFLMLMSHHQTAYINANNANKYIENAKQYMKVNFHRKLTICEIADNLNISDRYLYNLFIKHEKISPKKYLNNLRLNHACNMLKNKDFTITDVAFSCGFENVLEFSSFFSKNIHISPSAYKKLNG